MMGLLKEINILKFIQQMIFDVGQNVIGTDKYTKNMVITNKNSAFPINPT